MAAEIKKNINGYCPYCAVSLDGGNIFKHFLDRYGNETQAREAAKMYAGWEQHGLDNCWDRAIGHSSIKHDMVMKESCPDCKAVWDRFTKKIIEEGTHRGQDVLSR